MMLYYVSMGAGEQWVAFSFSGSLAAMYYLLSISICNGTGLWSTANNLTNPPGCHHHPIILCKYVLSSRVSWVRCSVTSPHRLSLSHGQYGARIKWYTTYTCIASHVVVVTHLKYIVSLRAVKAVIQGSCLEVAACAAKTKCF